MKTRNFAARAGRWSAQNRKWLEWLPWISRGADVVPQAAGQASSGLGAPRGGLAVDVVRDGDAARLILAGELDLNTAAWLGERIRRVEAEGPGTLILDLRGLGFIDSSGLGELFAAQRRAHEAGRRLVLVKGSESIDRVLELVRAEDAVETVDDPASIGPDGER